MSDFATAFAAGVATACFVLVGAYQATGPHPHYDDVTRLARDIALKNDRGLGDYFQNAGPTDRARLMGQLTSIDESLRRRGQ